MIQGRIQQQSTGRSEAASSPDAVGMIPVTAAPAELEVDATLHAPVIDPRSVAAVSKRVFDLVIATIALVLLAPIMVLIALAVKLDSRGPVLFRAPRIGRNGEFFHMLKFRTMVSGADEQRDDLRHLSEAPDGLFKMQHDPRLTRSGRLLRALLLDELPQLVHVVTGRMSLVGPRPLPPEEDELIRGAGRRLRARPAITGPWQLAGSWRVPLSKMVQLDDDYLTNWSIWLDVKMLARTFVQVFRHQGV
jgi:lipopolysaccharide/colanic/teichoic acid biosynthesis glycosyltransferase